jgi:hypothetical protein
MFVIPLGKILFSKDYHFLQEKRRLNETERNNLGNGRTLGEKDSLRHAILGMGPN